MGVQFEDYSDNVKSAIKSSAIAFLHEIGGEIRSQAQRNSRRKTSQTSGSYEYKVDEGELAVHIGSDYWNAIYEEFGTGEHSIKGNGRKGYWVFVDTGGKPQAPKGGKTYTKEEAKKVVAIMRSKGLNAYYTNGKTANRPLYRAFTATEGKIQSVADKCFSNLNGGSGGGKGYSLKNYFKDVKAKTDALETAMDDPSSLAPSPKMPSLPHAKMPSVPKAKTPKIFKNLK
ncbi:HK97 gp10 family phage protein [Anaerostipes hadrus]|nr:HK97 gp10 family phage protein [Anaerostipes hadrus]